MAMVEAMTILEAAAYLSFVLGAAFAVYQLRTIARDRQTELIMRVGEFMCSKEFQDPLCRLWKTTAQDAEGLERDVSYVGLSMIADYCEGLASLTARNLIKKDLVRRQYAFEVLWENMQPWVLAERTQYPNLYEGFERLASAA